MKITLKQKFINQFLVFYPLAKYWFHRFHGGIFLQQNKSLLTRQAIRETLIPKKLILPLQQQVGQTAEPLVKVGDRVKKNQLIACSSKNIQKVLIVPIHAPTSGTIEAIENHPLPHASGLMAPAIIIKPDFKNQAIKNVLKIDGQAPSTPAQIKDILFHAGIVGMGGAGFPTYAKLPEEAGKIHTLLINGVECEPFITCDDLLMQTRAEDIIKGAVLTANALGAKRVICGIEINKPEAIKAMRKAAKRTLVSIELVSTVYPTGGQKQLIYELLGIEVPQGSHSINIGLLVMNVATYAAIYQAITFGDPLTSRLVTVSGLGLSASFNMEVLIGTPFDILAKAAKPTVPLDYSLIMGGPMMGFKVQNNQVPVIKTTNCILANPPEPTNMQMPCIRCGECMDVCPVNLLPQQMYWHSQAHEFDKVEKLNIADCIECGCCDYVCPSQIPLVQYYRFAKAEIKIIHAEEKAVTLAKQRHEFRQARIEREKQEREVRLKAKKDAIKKQAIDKVTEANKPSAIAAANSSSSTKDSAKIKSNIPTARKKAIEAAKKVTQQVVSKKSSKVTVQKLSISGQPNSKEIDLNTKQTQSTIDTSSEDKHKKAMDVARKRVADRKAKQQASTK